MKRATDMRTVFAAALVAVCVVTAPLAGAVPTVDGGPVTTLLADDPSAESELSSGESLSGALTVHRAELEGSVDRRSLAGELAVAEGSDGRAALLAERRIGVERRIETLEDRRTTLRAQRRNGTLSPSAYRVRAAALTAELQQHRKLLASIERESRALPDPVRRAYGIDGDGLNRSWARVAATGDPSFDATFAAIVGEEPPDDVETASWADARQETELALRRTQATRDAYRALLDRGFTQGMDEETRTCTRRNLSAADDALANAEAAIDRDESASAESALVDARTDLRRAHVCLERLEGNRTAEEWDDYEWNGSDAEHEWNGSDTEYEFDRNDGDDSYEKDDAERDGFEYDREKSDWNTTSDGT